ncbi:MAG: zinc-ribbon domain-containing protein [Sphingomonadales bacterium]|nr:zinc-ribbon domain-containing protein [Sphingomonadales bacterium]
MLRYCTACGSELSSEMRFCGYCGTGVKMPGAAPSSQPIAPDPTPPAVPPVPPSIEHSVPTASVAVPPPPPPPPPSPPPASAQPDDAGDPPVEAMSIAASPISPTPAVPPEQSNIPGYALDDAQEEQEGGFNKLWLAIGAGVILVLAALYYVLFLADDFGGRNGGTPTAEVEKEAPLPVTSKIYYANSAANIRDAASVEGSTVTGKLKRGDEAKGKLIESEEGGERWLELDDGRGFVNLINLTENAMPALKSDLGRKVITLAGNAELWNAPADDATIVDRLSKGLSVTVSGITQNDYLEIILKKGGVGYIADGEAVLAAAEKAAMGPPIAIKLDPQGCAAGPEIKALFDQLYARQAAKRKAIEDADYPNDAARDAALTKYETETEGRSDFLKVRRNFKGLTVTGIAQHYESQSVYFAESPEIVRELFRSLGVKVGDDGQLPSRDIYAGIDPSRNPDYGKTDMGCGV